jgi:hypothetical protein
MKPITQPSYSNIFNIYNGTTHAAGFTPGATFTTRNGVTMQPFMPQHRGLNITTNAAGVTLTFTGMDGVSAFCSFPANTQTVFPVIVKSYNLTGVATGLWIQGLN